MSLPQSASDVVEDASGPLGPDRLGPSAVHSKKAAVSAPRSFDLKLFAEHDRQVDALGVQFLAE